MILERIPCVGVQILDGAVGEGLSQSCWGWDVLGEELGVLRGARAGGWCFFKAFQEDGEEE